MGIKDRLVHNRGWFTLGLELFGASLVVIGVSSVSVAAGLVVAGLLLIAIGYLLE